MNNNKNQIICFKELILLLLIACSDFFLTSGAIFPFIIQQKYFSYRKLVIKKRKSYYLGMCISLESVEYIKTLAEFVHLFGGSHI